MSKKFFGSCVVSPIEVRIRDLSEGTYFTWYGHSYCLLRHTKDGAICSKIGFPVPLFFGNGYWVLPSQSQIELELF